MLGPTRAENAGLTLLPIPIPSKIWKALDADRTKEKPTNAGFGARNGISHDHFDPGPASNFLHESKAI